MGKRLSETVDSGVGALDYKEREVSEKRASVLRKGKKRNIPPEETCKTMTGP